MNISFIVPCYNCADTLKAAVESIFHDNFHMGDEVIIIDDSSTDATPDVIEQLKKKYSSIVSARHNINKGSAAASRNTAIDLSGNELLFCLDADNILMPGTVGPLKHFLSVSNLDAAAFGEILYFKKTTAEVSDTWFMQSSISFIDALNHPQKAPCGSGNYLLKKSAWKKAGRYNESLGGALDSEIFGLCLLATGARFHTLQGYGYYHRHGYDSTYIRDIKKSNESLTLAAGIISHLHLIEPACVDYMLGSGRTNWRLNTASRPIKLAVSDSNGLKIKLKRRIFGLLERL